MNLHDLKEPEPPSIYDELVEYLGNGFATARAPAGDTFRNWYARTAPRYQQVTIRTDNGTTRVVPDDAEWYLPDPDR